MDAVSPLPLLPGPATAAGPVRGSERGPRVRTAARPTLPAPAPPGDLVPAALALPAPRTGVRTVGVEEELLLVDPASGRPVPRAGEALAAAGRAADPLPGKPPVAVDLTTELQQEQLETATPPRTDAGDLLEDLRRLRAAADDAARAVGARAAALACSPLPVRPHLAPGERYAAIAAQFARTSAEQLTSGCHVHVAVTDAEEGVGVLDRLRPWLATLLALSANSPFADGLDTGYAAWRPQAWVRWPGSGPSDPFGSAAAYRATVAAMLGTGVPLDEGMVYLDARLSARWPTVEIRVADVCLDPRDAVLLAVLARALVTTAAQEHAEGRPVPVVPTPVLRLASWRASRSGTEDVLVHPVTVRPVPAPVAVAALVTHVRPALEEAGDLRRAATGVARVLRRGGGARRQRQVLAATGDLAAVVADAVERTRG
ncbi:glutamate--cysteine ligase [Cellulomonas endophytica]|uniref:glutamate--cysteine ligase n=1 Tax=Cellulomonas endophytica TaxID=2494735 RepID=UPI001F0C7A00|nr:glutamate--cysteine ligase [Cellulomonas endophytica]